MALSGSTAKQYTTKGAYWVWVEWSGTQNIANNTTTITAITYAGTNSYGYYTGSNNGSSVTVNGQTTSAGDSGDVGYNTTKKELCRRTEVVEHNSDGTKSVVISGRWWYSGTFDLTSSGTFTLNTIARASIPTLSTSTQAIGSAITIYTNKKSDSFSHRVYSDFYDGFWTRLDTQGVIDSFTWTIPTGFASKIPSATSGSGRIAVETYNGSTLVGTNIVNFTATVPDTASYRPLASTPSKSIYGSGRDKTIAKYVQGISRVTVSFTATNQGGASITSSSINVKRQSDNGNSMNISGTSGTSGTLTLPGTYLITATTTDSRGRSTSSTTTFEVEAYAVPKISSYTAVRNSTTKTTVNNNASGTYTYMGGSNPLSVVIAKKLTTDTSFTNLNTTSGTTTGTFSNTFASTGNTETASYNFRVTITDSFGKSATSLVTVSTSSVALSIKKDTGIGVGKVWETGGGALDLAGGARLTGPIYVDGVLMNTSVLPPSSVSWGSFDVSPTKGGYSGFHFTAGNTMLMVRDTDGLFGVMKSGAWTWYVDGSGALAVGSIPWAKLTGVPSYVPTSRTVNGKALTANISLTASDVGAAASSHTHAYQQTSNVAYGLTGTITNATWTAVSYGKTFGVIPSVVATGVTNIAGDSFAKIRNRSTTGFEIIVGGTGASNAFNWIAIVAG